MPQKILKGDGCTQHIMSELGANHERVFVIGGKAIDIAKMAVSTSDMSYMPQKVTQSSLLAAIHKVSELSKVA